MLTSIVILTRNQLDRTQRCLQSIRAHTDAPYELIVVDNGSTDGTAAWLRAQPDVRPIVNDNNRGFAAASNQGAETARGDYVLLLNNDTVATPRWLSQLTSALHENGGAAIVGPMSNYVMTMQAVDASFNSDDSICRFGEAFNRRQPDKWRETSAISGFCMLMRLQTWRRLGGLDEDYQIGGYEDIDIGYRALRAGLRLRIAGDTFVYHEGSRSFGGNDLDVRAIAGVNRRLFLRKWGFNPDRLHWQVEPAFVSRLYVPAHPHHQPQTQEAPSGWYAKNAAGSVYRIERGCKRPVVSARTLHRLNIRPNRISLLSDWELRSFPDGVPLDEAGAFPASYPDTFVAKDSGGNMFMIAYGIRYPICNEAAFAAMGLRPSEAVPLTGQQLYSLYPGWPISEQVWDDYELPDYRLYRGPDGRLYYSEGQRLRAVSSEASLSRYGLRAEDAHTLPAEIFVRAPRGYGLP